MLSLPLLLLFWGLGSQGFPATTLKMQEDAEQTVQVNVEFQFQKWKSLYLHFPTVYQSSSSEHNEVYLRVDFLKRDIFVRKLFLLQNVCMHRRSLSSWRWKETKGRICKCGSTDCISDFIIADGREIYLWIIASTSDKDNKDQEIQAQSFKVVLCFTVNLEKDFPSSVTITLSFLSNTWRTTMTWRVMGNKLKGRERVASWLKNWSKCRNSLGWKWLGSQMLKPWRWCSRPDVGCRMWLRLSSLRGTLGGSKHSWPIGKEAEQQTENATSHHSCKKCGPLCLYSTSFLGLKITHQICQEQMWTMPFRKPFNSGVLSHP